MNVKQLMSENIFLLGNYGENGDTYITKAFCCDFLSFAMSKAPTGCAWVTVMANSNTLAVASLVEVSCIIFAEGVTLDSATLNKAKEHNITIMYTELPIFDAALRVHQLIQESAI